MAFVLIILCTGIVSAQEMVTSRQAFLLKENSPDLSTSAKDALCSTLREKAPADTYSLAVDTRVRVLARTRFMVKETVYDRENAKETSSQRLVKAALVEVLNGDSSGRTGWIVISYRDTGGDPQVILAQAVPGE
ncbi:MAG TPA: hypothetical protein EYO33_16575 [Phycisphaerales bacterium]|nr:hypothetical protein [Phycisphaerales bacterium]